MSSRVNSWTSKSTRMIGTQLSTVIRRMLATRTRRILAALGPTISVRCGMPKRMGFSEIALTPIVTCGSWFCFIRDFWNFLAFTFFPLLHLSAPF